MSTAVNNLKLDLFPIIFSKKCSHFFCYSNIGKIFDMLE